MGNCQKDSEEVVQAESDRRLRTGPMQQMQITCLTWNKDYQGLFDFQSKDLTKQAIWVNQSGAMMKINNEFKVVTQLTKSMITENADKFLFKFIKRPDCFYIEPIAVQANGFVYEKALWMVVKSTPNHEYSLREGDVIKLGRQKIRVKEKIYKEKESDERNIPNREVNCKKTVYRQLVKSKTSKTVTASNFNRALQAIKSPAPLQKTVKQAAQQHEQSKQQQKTIPNNQNQSQLDQPQPLCRICLDPGLPNNPLITPCKCAGSMRFIHLKCLQTWLGKRLNPLTQSHCVTINWKPLLCQLCMSHFLYKIYLDDKKYYTVEIPRPPKPYLVMQIIHKDKDKKKIYSLVSFSDKRKLNLGRKHDTDVRISEDISVSRHHASVRFEEKSKEYLIEDAASKFGTLILIKKRLVVRDISNGLAIQVGPNVFGFQVRRAFGVPGQQLPREEEEEELEEGQDDDEDVEEDGEEEEGNAEEEENLRNQEQSPMIGRGGEQQPTMIQRVSGRQQGQERQERQQQAPQPEERKEEAKQQ